VENLNCEASREKELASGWKFRYIVEAFNGASKARSASHFVKATIHDLTKPMIKVAIVEDDTRFRESLSILINGATEFQCVGAFGNAEAALQQIPQNWPDVVLMDINLPNISGIECVAKLKAARPALQFVMLTVYMDDEKIFSSLQAGASGYLLKQTPPVEILAAITGIRQGGSPMSNIIARRLVEYFQRQTPKPAQQDDYLTKREEEILTLVAKGYQFKEIADQLGISFTTVRTHIQNIYEKLHVRSRTEAAVKFLGRGKT
jgi:DNA-binding NarL/FixJ family response regulator